MFSWFKKKSPGLPSLDEWEKTCPDCGVERGRLHHLDCTRERCPFCAGQLISCDCRNEVLSMTPEERKAGDEYIDDSVEPLRGIMARWEAALEAKGRVLFQPARLEASPESLILVAARGALLFVRAVLAAGVPVDAVNEVKQTALMAAASNCQVVVVAFLLEAGADVRRQNVHGHTALHCAVSSVNPTHRQVECVRMLLRRGALVNACDESGGTALMSAAWFGCEASVEALLRASADPAAIDSKGRTARDLAMARGHAEIARMLDKG
jgi:ankyrin repeat protein